MSRGAEAPPDSGLYKASGLEPVSRHPGSGSSWGEGNESRGGSPSRLGSVQSKRPRAGFQAPGPREIIKTKSRCLVSRSTLSADLFKLNGVCELAWNMLGLISVNSLTSGSHRIHREVLLNACCALALWSTAVLASDRFARGSCALLVLSGGWATSTVGIFENLLS